MPTVRLAKTFCIPFLCASTTLENDFAEAPAVARPP
jgi:hypothetical protein